MGSIVGPIGIIVDYLLPDLYLGFFLSVSVLVHSGGVHGGHYYAYIRPTLSDQWYKFDDERVTKEELKRALDEQYGGEEEVYCFINGWLSICF
jgi:hypothetical protein